MCTAITLRSGQGETFFGRTMDFSYPIEPGLFMNPRNSVWNSGVDQSEISSTFGFLGVGQESGGMFAFFDGVNEKGFAAASLYFAGYAQYDDWQAPSWKKPVANVDFLRYILGKCGSVEDLKEIVKKVRIVGLEDPVTGTIAPLHWIAADRNGGCVVIEQTEKGFHIFQNPIGVLANSPDFMWQMTNLRNYMDASPRQTEQTDWGEVHLTPFGQGAGTNPLPGSYTSPARFVRTAYQKTHIAGIQSRDEAIMAGFHIMESVSVSKGAVLTDRGTWDYTRYTAFINLGTCEYFFRSYDNSQIFTSGLAENCQSSTKLIYLGNLDQPVKFQKLKEN